MAENSDGPKEIGPSGEKGEKDETNAPRRARLHVLAAVGAAIVAVGAIAATTWALANRADDSGARPPTKEETSESDTSSASPTYWASYGPTLPGTPSTLPTLPSFPTSSLDDDPAPSSPLTFPTPSVPYATTTSSYTPYTPYTPSVTPTPTVTPTTPTTTPTQTPVKVWPVRPQATKISGCGTFGSLRIVKTTGVRYGLTHGDGRQGKWLVRAWARKGYVIAPDAKRRFGGNLGKHRPCPGDPTIDEVTKAPTGDSDPGAWDLTVATTVPGTRDRDLALTFSFFTEVRVTGSEGEDWSCQDVDDPVAAGTPIACTYTGDAPPDVTLRVVATDGDQAVEPEGTLALTTDGKLTDDSRF